MQRGLIVTVLVLFGALTAAALWYHGYWGILRPHFQSLATGQVLAGSLGPLLYLLTRPADASAIVTDRRSVIDRG